MCYSVAPSTTNQNATQGIYIKDIKWLGKSLEAYNIKMQYEIIFKGDRCCSCYTFLPQTSPAARSVPRRVASGTSPTAQHLLTIATPKQSPAHTHTCKQRKKLRNSTTKHKTANKTSLELFYALQRSHGHKEHLKQS